MLRSSEKDTATSQGPSRCPKMSYFAVRILQNQKFKSRESQNMLILEDPSRKC